MTKKEYNKIIKDIDTRSRRADSLRRQAHNIWHAMVNRRRRKDILRVLHIWKFRGLGFEPLSKTYDILGKKITYMLEQEGIKLYAFGKEMNTDQEVEYPICNIGEDKDDWLNWIYPRLRYHFWNPYEEKLRPETAAEFQTLASLHLSEFLDFVLETYGRYKDSDRD